MKCPGFHTIRDSGNHNHAANRILRPRRGHILVAPNPFGIKVLPEDVGSGMEPVAKPTEYVTDRMHREPVRGAIPERGLDALER